MAVVHQRMPTVNRDLIPALRRTWPWGTGPGSGARWYSWAGPALRRGRRRRCQQYPRSSDRHRVGARSVV